ncbi:MAG TPA: putative zinc-binding peptidase [Methylomirabilota bacterium]|nr:putative zinc-binding peptidase [Methylomirabilota bacterium]
MKTFFCQRCGGRLFFENTSCLACGSVLGFLPGPAILAALEPDGQGVWRAAISEGAVRLRKCHNYTVENVCNWMIPAEAAAEFCIACEMNRTVPDLSVPHHRALWSRLEAAKRRLGYTLMRLGLPLIPKSKDHARGLAFDFLADADPAFVEGERVLTGHAEGVITINLAEADDAVREKMRLTLREVYRTVLGHVRHESGHYYWDFLVRGHPRIQEARAVFGDDRTDYAQALERHYAQGPPEHWERQFVTPYAAAHPWEDWAETWAHFLHIMDTLETAAANGLEIRGPAGRRFLRDPFANEFPAIREDWHALRFVLNSLNRSMGLADAYPFVVTDAVAAKLEFIHRWVTGTQAADSPAA